MTTAINVGDKIGLFTVTGRESDGRRLFFICVCECGTAKRVRSDSLGRDIVSCGCKKRAHLIGMILSHGKCNHPIYSVWEGMKSRCYNPHFKQFKDYGGRGISVCREWRESFQAFLDFMGERPQGKTLDRYPNNDGNYEPGNCRWASRKEQQQNRRKAA